MRFVEGPVGRVPNSRLVCGDEVLRAVLEYALGGGSAVDGHGVYLAWMWLEGKGSMDLRSKLDFYFYLERPFE
jgi:hypothetical protein